MPTWNKQQLEAIQTKEKNILVSASAGSGKTTVLVARLMDLVLKDHVAIEEILAMTFTEAAANEMKKRLAKELQTAWNESLDEQEKAFLSHQLTSLNNAYISTIHSFCLSILQKYYYVIGLDHERVNNIMDNGTMVLYQQQALEEALQKQYETFDHAFLTLTQMFSARPEDMDGLHHMIMQLAALANSKPNPEQWLSSLIKPYQNVKHINDLPQEITTHFFAYLSVQTLRYEEIMQQLETICMLKYANDDKGCKALEKIRAKISALSVAKEALAEKEYETFRTSFQGICRAIVPTAPDKEDKAFAKIRKQITDIEDQLLALLFREYDFMQDLTTLETVIQKLIDITRDYQRSYEAIKEKNKQIDFDDMEHFALAILDANHQAVSTIYRNQFKQIMVDEFQDSNDVQNALVMRIAQKDNVFRVGDIKQSIYGFRHAKPQLMKGLIDNRTAQDRVIYLSNNYRSKEMIVEFNNELFKQLMNTEGFDCSYCEQDDVATGVDEQQKNNVPIVFHAIFHNEFKEKEELILSKNSIKASYIANQILEIKAKEERSWKEFVVLVRGNARKDDMKSVFDELHIPYFIDIKHGFYQSTAVQIILSTLHCIYAPHEDIPFVASMLSPLFQFQESDLAEIKMIKEKGQSYYAYLCEHSTPDFMAFQDLRKKRKTLRLSEMLNALYNVHDFYELHTSMQEKTNLDLLFEKAIQFEEQNACGIPSFLSYIDQIKDAQTAEAIPIGADADVVRVMSIHQSKGLQFPVVFLWSTDRMTPIEFKEFCISDADLGIAMKAMELPQRYVRTTIPRIAMEHKKDKEELEEEMRILYVATTRAQQQMHIVDCLTSLQEYQKPLTMSSIYERKGYTSWILQTFYQNPSSLFTIKEVHDFWCSLPQEEQQKPIAKIQHYQHDTSSIRFTTPSTTAVHLPAFQPMNSNRTKHGSMIHKMIEHLPAAPWSEGIIQQIATTLSIPIKTWDMQALLQLGNNVLYQRMQQNEYHHELPFMVKTDQEIVHGYIDFISISKNEVQILDFKTDAIAEDQFYELYHSQLTSYKKAIQRLYPDKTCLSYIYSLHLHKMISIS